MTTTVPTRTGRAPWIGVSAAVALVVVAAVLPWLLGWDVNARSEPEDGVPPLHGTHDVRLIGPGTVPALLLGLLGWRHGVELARRLPWRALLATSFVVGLAWLLSLAAVDGLDGITDPLLHEYEYLRPARGIDDVGAVLDEWVERIPRDHPRNLVTHVAGHPPLALLFFVGLVRLGLGGDLAAPLSVIVVAASATPAVLVTLRTLGAEAAARRAAPFLVLGPAALFTAVSADGMFAAVAAWGLAALAAAATRRSPAPMIAWSVVAGVLLGCCVLLSYGLVLLGPLALAVLAAARSWWPLPIAALAALGVVLGFAVAGFAWWEAYPVLRERYWDGLASDRPPAYWMWANLAALVLAAGPVLGAGLGQLVALRSRAHRTVVLLVSGAVAAIVLADLSQMSRAEVERIWLPFVPWLLVSTALLPERWRRWGLGAQILLAVLMEHLLHTSW